MTIEQVNLFYEEMRKAFVKTDSSWTDKGAIFRTILEQFFKLLTRELDEKSTLFDRISAYYISRPDEEEFKDLAHQVRMKTNRSVHNNMRFGPRYVKHYTLSKEEITEIYYKMVQIVESITKVQPDKVTLELLGINGTDYLNELNEQQKDAVLAKDRIVFVNAGPGTGKTTLLVQRMIHAILSEEKLKHIVALSFTNTAAKQLKDKFNKQAFEYLRDEEYELFSGTIHSYCLRSLRKYHLLKGISQDYMIISEEELLDSSREIAQALGAKYTVDQISENLKKAPGTWPEDIKAAVEDIKKKHNVIALNDILKIFWEKLNNEPEFANWILESADILVIDEAQDLSEYNFKVFEQMLCLKPTLKLFMVGDPRQNIFEFNGGSYKYLDDFMQVHKEDSTVKDLSISYRCPGPILDYVNKFNFSDCCNVALKSEVTGNLELSSYKTMEDECQFIVDQLLSSDDLSSYAVLSTDIKGFSTLIDKLNENSIPFIVHGGKRRLKPHIRYMNNLLRIIHNSNLKSIRATGKTLGMDLFAQPLGAPRNFSEKEIFLRSPFGRKLSALAKEYNRMEWSLSTLITELSKSFLPAQWYADSNVITDYEKLIMMAAGYKSIKEYIDAFTVNKERFLCFFDKNFKDCTTETEGTSVTLSTIHSAKGLEWKHVFIIGMNDQNFPGIKKYDNQNPSKHEVYLNKKRKELFVALTRTAETLSISYPELVEGQDQTPSMLLTGLTVKKS